MNFYWSAEEIQTRLKEIMVKSWHEVEEISKKHHCTLREAAFISALKRLEASMQARGW